MASVMLVLSYQPRARRPKPTQPRAVRSAYETRVLSAVGAGSPTAAAHPGCTNAIPPHHHAV
eukprot:11159431-Lingulodinium_polyedra.AAC.1